MRIGILGGTFNPVHLGHLIMAETAREQFDLDKVLFIPAAIPPHKRESRMASAPQRFHMLERALAGNSYFEASDMEIRRGGKSYSYDTLRELTARSGGRNQLFFIIGSDSLRHILSWYRIADIMKLCRFIVVERPGLSVREILAGMSPAHRNFFGRYVTDSFPVGISSSAIRDRIRRGFSVRYLVGEAVQGYLEETGLYAKPVSKG